MQKKHTAIAMGMKSNSNGNNGVKVGGIALTFICSALLLWVYDSESWVLSTILAKSRLQSPSQAIKEAPVSILEDKRNHTWDSSVEGGMDKLANETRLSDDRSLNNGDINNSSDSSVEGVMDKQANETSLSDDRSLSNGDRNKTSDFAVESGMEKVANESIFSDDRSLGIRERNTKTPDLAPKCDIFTGSWVYDESYVLYSAGQCPYSSPGFNCQRNGRKDSRYQKWRWQPRDCDIPRFNASEVLEKLRGKRLMYAGDSISRSQWESMLCLLSPALSNGDASITTSNRGRTLKYVIKSYNCSVELSWAPFLVRQHAIPATNTTPAKETLELDNIDEQSSVWNSAHVIVFNTGHWWTHELPYAGDDYFEEGGKIHSHMDESVAFEKAIRTWGSWVDANMNPVNTQVFFQAYSPVHFDGKMWGKRVGGGCFKETEPIVELEEKEAQRNPDMKRVVTVARVAQEMRTEVRLLNITWMSMHRKDAHCSIYTNADVNNAKAESDSDYSRADCSHWCLPGVPDVWNHLLSVLII